MYQKVHPVDFSSAPRERHTLGESNSNSLLDFFHEKENPVSHSGRRDTKLSWKREREETRREREREGMSLNSNQCPRQQNKSREQQMFLSLPLFLSSLSHHRPKEFFIKVNVSAAHLHKE